MKMPKMASSVIVERWMTITPEMAEHFLLNAHKNRNLKIERVLEQAQDIIDKKWRKNGETMKFDREGRCFDGQHRLNAVVLAKMPIEVLVVLGLDYEEVMSTIDTGCVRRFSDVLAIDGEAQTTVLAGVASLLWRQENGFLGASVGHRRKASHSELAATLERHKKVRDSMHAKHGLAGLLTPSLAVFLHYRWSVTEGKSEEINRFFEMLRSGESLTGPVLRLRELLQKNARSSRNKLTPNALIALTSKAIIAAVEGKQMKQLKWHSDGENPEPFPYIPGDSERRPRRKAVTVQGFKDMIAERSAAEQPSSN